MTLDIYADLFDEDLDAVADRLDAKEREAGVYPMCTGAEVIEIANWSGSARGRQFPGV